MNGEEAIPPLPSGWDWCDWSHQRATMEQWKSFTPAIRQAFSVRLQAIPMAMATGRSLPREKFFWDKGSGIGKAKIRTDNPGWRAFVFRDGRAFYLTHFSRKTTRGGDHERQIATALEARTEHMARRKR